MDLIHRGWLNHHQKVGTMAKNTSRTTQINGMNEGDAMCRVMVGNHVPAPGWPVVERTAGGGYDQRFICANCGTEVHRYRDRRGFLLSRRNYKYQDGYLLQEGGRMTRSEKASVFIRFADAMQSAKA
jgi:hypothetical protein